MKKAHSKLNPVYKLAKQRVNTLLKAIEADSAGTISDELVHEVRLCTKRLRALLQLYQPSQTSASIKFVDQRIKALADFYSGQRDTHVQYEILCQAAKMMSRQNQNDIQPLLHYFSTLKQQTTAQSVSVNVSAKFEYILQAWKEKLTPEALSDFESGVDFAYRKSRKLAHAAKLTDKDETYHQCRKWVKYYIYQLQMLVQKKRSKDSNHLKQLTVLGDLLGELHDRFVLEQTLDRLLVNAKKENESAILVMQAWLKKQKRLDKSQCHALFKSVFVNKHNPIKV